MNMLVAGAPSATLEEDERTAFSKEALKRAFLDNLFYMQGKFPALATKRDYYLALAYVVRDRLLQRWVSTAAEYTKQRSRTVAYLSAEFLIGPHLGNNLINLGIYHQVKQAIAELGLDFDDLLQQEEEPGLGNGGLGRLAACFLDSMATLSIPTMGYGIRYEFGIFEQEIVDGWQVERTDKWLRFGTPWDIARPEWAVEVKVGGSTQAWTDEKGLLPAGCGTSGPYVDLALASSAPTTSGSAVTFKVILLDADDTEVGTGKLTYDRSTRKITKLSC